MAVAWYIWTLNRLYACTATHVRTEITNAMLLGRSTWKGYGSRHRVKVASKLKQVALAGKEFLSSPCSDLAWAAAEGAREFKALLGLLPQILSGMLVLRLLSFANFNCTCSTNILL